MKVIAINGSPKAEGNTYRALQVVLGELHKADIETELIQVGHLPLRSCIGCNHCIDSGSGLCVLGADGLNDAIPKVKEADGILLASPVHFSGITGAMKCFCDRLCYVAGGDRDILCHKVGAALVAVRRTGGSAALDSLTHYLTYHQMLVASSHYWSVIHGRAPGEVLEDGEGIQTLELLGQNMAWMLKLRRDGLGAAPESVTKVRTNFIR